jgi:ribosome-binding factor A
LPAADCAANLFPPRRVVSFSDSPARKEVHHACISLDALVEPWPSLIDFDWPIRTRLSRFFLHFNHRESISMRKRKLRRRFDRPLCASIGPDDGLDPRDWGRGERRPMRNRKALQLCRQVAETLNLALGDCADPLLQELIVCEVRPCPDTSRLLVRVQSGTGAAVNPALAAERLRAATGRLRGEVASAVHRRRAPDLLFQVCSR